MRNPEYELVELPALEQLQQLGWVYIDGKDLSPDVSSERNSFKDVVLFERLTNAVRRLNPWISEENLHKVVRDLTMGQYTNLLEANQTVWETLNNCVSVQQDICSGNKGQTVHLIDFENPENNDFVCVNQFTVSGPIQNIIPDIVLFVNGLPLTVIECKNPTKTNPKEEGIKQLLRYSNNRTPADDEGAEKLFHFNQIMVSTSSDQAHVGTITSKSNHYLEWKDPYPCDVATLGDTPTAQEIMIQGLFTPTNFLDLIQNFVVFEPMDGKVIKKLARYQQFRAVHKTIERIKTGESRLEKGGVIWHTQGSGKSLTMVFLTIKIRRDPQLRDHKLVFLTDRTQLDGQLLTTFTNAQNETIYHADSVKSLQELLRTDSSNIVIAMVQKFQESADNFDFPLLNDSDKIIVLADEAHRTQYGALGAAINTALPNAPKIAFTGTPLIKTQKTSYEFGTYIDTYTIEQAVQDGATIQLLYEGREAQVKVTGDSLDSLFDEYFADRTDEEKQAIKDKYGTTQSILEAPQRIRRVCIDILKHYREQIQPNGFKAMIVTSSRRAAITYKEQLDALGAPENAVIISGDHNDEKQYWEHTNPVTHKQQIDDFKKPLGSGEKQSELSFLIVKDMLLTGFDAPVAQVMYLDRKLSDHTLLQAIARVNRTNKNKFRGYIVDYYGLTDYLTEALEMFSTEDVAEAMHDIKNEIPKLTNSHTRAIGHFTDLDDIEKCLPVLKDEIKRQTFQTDLQTFSKQMDIVLPNPAATPYLKDLKQLGNIAIRARNLYRDDHLDISDAGEIVRALIEEHVYSTGVDPRIAPLDLFDFGFKEKVAGIKTPQGKAAEIEQAVRSHIAVNSVNDPEYYKSLAKQLEAIIAQHEHNWDDLVGTLFEFLDTIETNREQSAQELGLTETERAFYGILKAELTKTSGSDELDEDTHNKALTVTRSLVAMMNEATEIVDFFNKWNATKKMKKQIKHTIIEHFDPSLVKPITNEFMDLAKVKFQ